MAILCLSFVALFFIFNAFERPEDEVSVTNAHTLVLPDPDPGLQTTLERVLSQPPFKQSVEQRRLSVAFVDLSDPKVIRYSGVQDDTMRYAASLPKIAILLAVFDQIDKGNLTYTQGLKHTMEQMIRYSSNKAASRLLSLVGFPSIAETLKDPRYELYDPKRNGGLWVGKDYGGGLGRWDRDPLHNVSHGATARQVARFFVMLDKGMLLNRWTCREMQEILSRPGLMHKFAKGLANRPGSAIYRKSGSWKSWHCDAALVERGDKKYVAVALLESFSAENTLCRLILELDDVIHSDTVPLKSRNRR
ncbi:class A beta-lactamase-related serine hydrolase [Acidobacteria bacterium AH-259-O06]|nr:class A beta-lactamase-related serine hydrolase [Acidobacteria bacterium AH-259-O06]